MMEDIDSSKMDEDVAISRPALATPVATAAAATAVVAHSASPFSALNETATRRVSAKASSSVDARVDSPSLDSRALSPPVHAPSSRSTSIRPYSVPVSAPGSAPASRLPSHARSPRPNAPVPEVSMKSPVSVDEAPPRMALTNGNSNGHRSIEAEGLSHEDNLSPPSDNMSRASSIPINAFEDEIVVGSHHTHIKSSPHQMSPGLNTTEMEGIEDDQPVAAHYPKRKRASIYADLSEDRIEMNMAGGDGETGTPGARPSKPAKLHGLGGVKGVTLGYWRDSPVPNEEDKHGVIGFIDVRDRLRTRIQPTSRGGKHIIHQYPLPPGPGGSWVTFGGVVFNGHLVNLDHYQVKEYVKIRSDTMRKGETPEEADAANKAAVKEAIRRVAQNPPPETAAAPPIAYGPEIPKHAQVTHRPEPKKRRVGNATGNISGPGPATTSSGPLDNLPGTRPTKILLGYWLGSSEQLPENKHAVFGILGSNDMFRVKVTRETRDGQPLIGNFPTGAGALWIPYDEVEFDDHLKHLARPEIKEYCRVRQYQLDRGEYPDDRQGNMLKAVTEAQARVMQSFSTKPSEGGRELPTLEANGHITAQPQAVDSQAGFASKRDSAESRPLRRSDAIAATKPARHSLPDSAQLRAANRPERPGSVDAIERTNSIARREIARVEAVQQRNDMRAASREAQAAQSQSSHNKSQFADNMSRLNKVWAAQEANRLKAGAEDAKIWGGIKYERKQNGPFQGKLVSQGTIISIDGEDYVEYRVLTKPTFV